MYKDLFGLRKLPFNLTPDADYLYLSPKHAEALAGLTYAIQERKGFVVLTGDAGTGKTTLLSSVISQLPAEQVQSSILLNPILTPSEFLEWVLLDFGIATVPASKAQRLWTLQKFLLQTYLEKRIAILVIDEAHKLGLELLEEIRLLGNFEYGAQKFLQIILLGQCELDGLLNRQDLRQFRQRIALRVYIDALPAAEVGEYIRFRWAKAGGAEIPFTPEAVERIAAFSRGLPRVINSLCDTALLMAFGEARHAITAYHIGEAATNLGMTAAPVTVFPESHAAFTPDAQPACQDPIPVVTPAAAARVEEEYDVLPSFESYGASRKNSAPAMPDAKPIRQDSVPSVTLASAAGVKEEYDVPSFASYGAPRKNSALLKLLARKFSNGKNTI